MKARLSGEEFTPSSHLSSDRQVCLSPRQPSCYSALLKAIGGRVEDYFCSDLENEVPGRSESRLKAGESDIVKSLPVKKRGKPLLLGEKLDSKVKSYIPAVREKGGVVTTSITMAAATAIIRKADRNLLAENGGPITITNNWAKSLLYRMNIVKRRGSSTTKFTVANFDAVKEQFIIDVNVAVEMEDIPPQLVINWDQTGISIVPSSSWTMEAKGSKQVEIVRMGDKRQITAVFCGHCPASFYLHSSSIRGKPLLVCLVTNFQAIGM